MQGKDIAIVVGAVVLVVLLIALLSGGMMGPGMMGWGGVAAGWGILMMLLWVLVIVGVVLLVVWLLRQGRPLEAGPGSGGGRALEILQERYARGEITREQYEQMRRDLAER